MNTRNDKINGDLTVKGDLNFAGLASGTLHVPAGAKLLLTGLANGLVVESGGRAIIRGTVTGAVINSGEVEVHGTVGGVTDTGPAASTHILPGAVVGGIRQ